MFSWFLHFNWPQIWWTSNIKSVFIFCLKFWAFILDQRYSKYGLETTTTLWVLTLTLYYIQSILCRIIHFLLQRINLSRILRAWPAVELCRLKPLYMSHFVDLKHSWDESKRNSLWLYVFLVLDILNKHKRCHKSL